MTKAMFKNILIVFLAIWLLVAPGCCTIAQGSLFKNPPIPYGGTILCTGLLFLAVEHTNLNVPTVIFLPFLIADWFLSFTLDTALLPISVVNTLLRKTELSIQFP